MENQAAKGTPRGAFCRALDGLEVEFSSELTSGRVYRSIPVPEQYLLIISSEPSGTWNDIKFFKHLKPNIPLLPCKLSGVLQP
jgi:hypothetical protein